MFENRSAVVLFIARCTATMLCIAILNGCASSETYPWPERMVKIEDMKPVNRIRNIAVEARSGEPKPTGTVILRLHVDERGEVLRTSVLESSRNAGIDKAAIKTFTATRFVPYTVNGVAAPVTVLAPLHFKP